MELKQEGENQMKKLSKDQAELLSNMNDNFTRAIESTKLKSGWSKSMNKRLTNILFDTYYYLTGEKVTNTKCSPCRTQALVTVGNAYFEYFEDETKKNLAEITEKEQHKKSIHKK